MPKFNADSDKRLHDPLEFTLCGKEFTVKPMTDDLMAAVQDALEALEKSGASVGALQNAQLALLTGEPEEAFAGADLRKKAGVLHWIQASLADPLGAGQQKAGRS